MSYKVLMQQLGFPTSQLLRRILEYLMNEREAGVAAALLGSVEEVTEKLDMDKGHVKEILKGLFFKGVVISKNFKRREYYKFARDIVQLHDATLASRHMRNPEYARLWKKFGEKETHAAMEKLRIASGVKVWRVVPAYNAIKDLLDVLLHKNIIEMIRAQERITIVFCSCRNVTHLVDDGCRFTNSFVDNENTWHCIQVGRGAKYIIERGSGIELNQEEAIELIHKIEEDSLVHTWLNTAKIIDRRVTVNCNCCSDCYEFFLAVKFANVPMEALEKNRYIAYVDEDACIACRTCEEECHFGAITIDDVPKVDEETCFSCGVCIVGCNQEAIRLKAVRPLEHFPS